MSGSNQRQETEISEDISLSSSTSEGVPAAEPNEAKEMMRSSTEEEGQAHVAPVGGEKRIKLALEAEGRSKQFEATPAAAARDEPQDLLVRQHFEANELASALRERSNEPLFHTDLHAHLLGCGDYNFWFEEIMLFELRKGDRLPAMFDIGEGRFLTVKEVETFLECLRTYSWENAFTSTEGEDETSRLVNHFFKEVIQDVKFKQHLKATAERFVELDVVFSVEKIAQAFCLDNYAEDVLISYICERLQCSPDKIREYLIFDARNQQFRWVRGIRNKELVQICEESEMAKAFIKNGFSMLSPSGRPPRPEDLIPYRGHFTPEFYPGRFALKDSIYSQRLDVLLRLLEHVYERCCQNKVPVNYMELSIGIGDASRKHVMAFLSPPIGTKLRLIDGLQQCLRSKIPTPGSRVDFKYLIGINRQDVSLPLGSPDFRNVELQLLPGSRRIVSTREGIQSWELMMNYPSRCITLLLNGYREAEGFNVFENMFNSIEAFEKCWLQEGRQDEPGASPRRSVAADPPSTSPLKDLIKRKLDDTSIVGFDLFGDEFAAPYCPFPSSRFLKYAGHLGFRIHFGESHPFVQPNSMSFMAWLTHMFIGLLSIYRMSEGGARVRVGHGVSIKELFRSQEERRRMSQELQPGARVLFHHCCCLADSLWPPGGKDDESSIPIEILLTSNEYLIPETQNAREILKTLRERSVTHFFSTDDEGVWPINGSPRNNFCIGLHGEYVMAIKHGLISQKSAIEMITNARKEMFSSEKFSGDSVGQSDPPIGANEYFGSKVLLCPVRLKVLHGEMTQQVSLEHASRLEAYVKQTCPWVSLDKIDLSMDPRPLEELDEKSASTHASQLIEKMIFKTGNAQEKIVVDFFKDLVTKLCKFKGSRPVAQFLYDGEIIFWMTVNQWTREMLKSELDLLRVQRGDKKVQLKLYIEREECLDYVKAVFQEPRNRELWIHTRFYISTLCSLKTVPTLWTKTPVPPFPREMSTFPLFYHSGLIPFLAEWVDENKLEIAEGKLESQNSSRGSRITEKEVTTDANLRNFPLFWPAEKTNNDLSSLPEKAHFYEMNREKRAQLHKDNASVPPPSPSNTRLEFPSPTEYWKDLAAKHYASLLCFGKIVVEYIELDYHFQVAEPENWLLPPLVFANGGERRYLYAWKLAQQETSISVSSVFDAIHSGLGPVVPGGQRLAFCVLVLRVFLDRFNEPSNEGALMFLEKCWVFANSEIGYGYTTVKERIEPLMEVTVKFLNDPKEAIVQISELKSIVAQALHNDSNWMLGNPYQYSVWSKLPAGKELLTLVADSR